MGIVGQIYSFATMPKIISGLGARKTVGQEVKKLGGKVVFVCTDKGIPEAGLLVDILISLSGENLAYVIFDQVESNPNIENIENGMKIYRNEQCDVLVAVGGGSVIDAAKAICAKVSTTAPDLPGSGSAAPVIIAVPTTAGTGAEILSKAVIADKRNNTKIAFSSPLQKPKVAILDPVMLQTLPANVAAATGMVTLANAVEGYISLGASELTDLLNLKSVQLVAKYLRRFIANRKDLEAATAMQNACLYSAMGSANAGRGIVYAMANSLTGHFDMHHGIACAVVLPKVMEFNAMASPKKYINIAKVFGENVSNLPLAEASQKAVEAVRKLAGDIGIPDHLPDVAITTEDIEQMAREVMESDDVKTNPRETVLQDVVEFYQTVF